MNTIKKLLLIVGAVFSFNAWATVEITGFEVSEAAGTGTWDVTITSQGESVASDGYDYMLDYTTVDGSAEDENGDDDYKKQQGTLDFSSGLTQQVVVPIVQDMKVEGDETLTLELYEVPPDEINASEQPAEIIAPIKTANGTIVDDDIELLVVVQFQGVGGGEVDLELDCQGNGTIDDSTKTTSGGEATFLVANFVEPLDCTADPISSPPGATIIASDCNPGMDEEDTECLIVFGPTRATFKVTKIFDDGNHIDEVLVAIDCTTGLILDQDKLLGHNEMVEFVVTSFNEGALDCTITEDGETGYSGEYHNVSLQIVNDESCEYLQVGGLDAHECVITNTPDPVDVKVTKNWIYEGSTTHDVYTGYTLTLYCDAEIEGGYQFGKGGTVESPAVPNGGGFCGKIVLPFDGPQGTNGFADWCKAYYRDGGTMITAKVIPEFPDSNCYWVESGQDPAVEVDQSDCQNLTISAGEGASCVITNTVFFEGIPTLSQYGMALLALLMLGVGFVSFRRFS
jgi:hypothetical protein